MANWFFCDPDSSWWLMKGARRQLREQAHRGRAVGWSPRYEGPREETGATEAQIDIFFGWHEKILLKARQVHYEGMNTLARMALAAITGWI